MDSFQFSDKIHFILSFWFIRNIIAFEVASFVFQQKTAKTISNYKRQEGHKFARLKMKISRY